jgi:hypothetical protein
MSWKCNILGHMWEYTDINQDIELDEIIYRKKRVCIRCNECQKEVFDMDKAETICWNNCELDIEDQRDIKLKELLK